MIDQAALGPYCLQYRLQMREQRTELKTGRKRVLTFPGVTRNIHVSQGNGLEILPPDVLSPVYLVEHFWDDRSLPATTYNTHTPLFRSSCAKKNLVFTL